MLGRSHAISGAAAYLAVVGPDPAGMALAALAALGPDIDHHASILGRLTPLHRILPHRGVTHYLLVPIAMYVAVGQTWWGFALALGWVVHQLGDLITRDGLRWLWPARVVIRGPIRAGGLVENAVLVPLMLFYIAWEGAQWFAQLS